MPGNFLPYMARSRCSASPQPCPNDNPSSSGPEYWPLLEHPDMTIITNANKIVSHRFIVHLQTFMRGRRLAMRPGPPSTRDRKIAYQLSLTTIALSLLTHPSHSRAYRGNTLAFPPLGHNFRGFSQARICRRQHEHIYSTSPG